MSEPATGGPVSRSYISQRLHLSYVDWGNEDAPPLILLHGGRDHCRNWDWVAARLRDRFHIIAPDLRGHGDSAWCRNGHYGMDGFVYDLAQLIHQQNLAPVNIVAHSLGGNIALRYTGLYPQNVRRVAAIEGLGPSPTILAELAKKPSDERMRAWIDEVRMLAARTPRKYRTIAEAFQRMKEENKHLSEAQAMHLTRHGVRQNEDGTYSWKFDNYVRAWPPHEWPREDISLLWSRIECPTLLFYGSESWASNPAKDGRAAYFKNARVEVIEGAGHWVHHDRLEEFLEKVEVFLS
jgi:pimeloyl-ACP methyl ester carboxylesterase